MQAALTHPKLPNLSLSRTPAEKLRYRSQDLLRGGTEIIIDHRGREYRLKLTRNDKLILNI